MHLNILDKEQLLQILYWQSLSRSLDDISLNFISKLSGQAKEDFRSYNGKLSKAQPLIIDQQQFLIFNS